MSPPRESIAVTPPAIEPPLEWGTRGGNGPLYPIVDGICIHGKIFPFENGALFAYGFGTGSWSRGDATTTAFVSETGLVPQPTEGFGKAFGFAGPTAIGGKYPERMFAVLDVSSRMTNASELYIGKGTDKSDWKKVLDSGAQWTDAGNARSAYEPTRNMGKPFPLGDGSYLLPIESDYTGTTDKITYSFRLINADGTLAPATAKVPGAALAQIAFFGSLARLDNGEIIGVTTDMRGAAPRKLVRWSPTRKVNDLAFPKGTAKVPPSFASGKKRAYIEVEGEIYVYDGGETLTLAKVNPKLVKGARISVGPDDELLVVLPTNVLLEEKPNGDVREEPLPATGALVGASLGSPWMIAQAKASDGSDMLYRRVSGKWESVTIPPPPFGTDHRSPLKVEALDVIGKDDVFLNVRRIEKGLGWKQPEPFRAIYRTKKPKEVMRCQDVRAWQSTGIGLWPWAPSADDTCKDIVVVVVQEQSGKMAADYPNLRAKLKGKTDYGETLTLVNFDGRGGSNLGIKMNDLAKAKALATYVSNALDLRAEVSCGKPTPTRTFTLDVAKGTFAF